MLNGFSLLQRLRVHSPLAFMLGMVCMLAIMPDLAHASETAAGLPYETALKKLKDSITGPVAFSISLMGIVGAGAALIFGGDMSGFLRTMVFLVLVVAIIVNAVGIVEFIGGSAATVAVHIEHSAQMLRGVG